jgi:hypothetical protein
VSCAFQISRAYGWIESSEIGKLPRKSRRSPA